MSEYADINIKKLSLFWFRNYVDSYIVSLLFSVKNLIITPNCKVDPEEDDSDLYTRYVYKTTVKDAKERLEAQGFSMANFQKVFNENIYCKPLTIQPSYVIWVLILMNMMRKFKDELEKK